MAVVDRNLRFLRVNRAFGVFQDREPSEIVGRTVGEALLSSQAQIGPAILEVFATENRSVRGEGGGAGSWRP